MAKITIEIRNADKIIRAFRIAPEIMAKRLQDELLKLGGYTVGEVKKHITMGTDMWKPPILTGAMRRGIQVRQSEAMKVVIMASEITSYALFVHEGTKFMKARPFFEITARRSGKEIERFFQKSLDSAVSDIVKLTK